MEDKNNFQVSEKQIDLISLANELFKGSKPMEGIERKILSEAIFEYAKSKPTLPGRR